MGLTSDACSAPLNSHRPGSRKPTHGYADGRSCLPGDYVDCRIRDALRRRQDQFHPGLVVSGHGLPKGNALLGDRNGALMGALARTATAVSLTMASLRSEGLHKTRAATGIMTSAVLDDIASLALVAVLVPLASGGSMISAAGLGIIVLKATVGAG